MARGESTPIHVDQDLKQMIGDKSPLLGDEDSSENYDDLSYSIPEVENEED